MTPTQRRSVTLALLAGTLVLAGCSPGQAPPAPTRPASTLPIDSSPADDVGGDPLTLIDDAGRSVDIPADPQRIVSLAPSNTEIVCAIGACDLLVGVPEFLDGYPEDVLATVADLPKVVAFGPVDREVVLATEPDLVLAAGNELTPSDDVAALAELGIPTLVLYPESVDEIYAGIELVGEAIGHEEQARALTAELAAEVEAVVAAVADEPRPRTFYEVSVFEGTIFTAGEGSFIASLVELAGGEPIKGDAVTTSIPLENLVAADPEVIVLGDAAYDPSITPDSVANRPGWEGMSAVAAGRVIPFEADLLLTRPGPRIADGLAALARVLHPEAFD